MIWFCCHGDSNHHGSSIFCFTQPPKPASEVEKAQFEGPRLNALNNAVKLGWYCECEFRSGSSQRVSGVLPCYVRLRSIRDESAEYRWIWRDRYIGQGWRLPRLVERISTWQSKYWTLERSRMPPSFHNSLGYSYSHLMFTLTLAGRTSHPLVTPYHCRLGDLLCFVFVSAYCMFDLSVYYLFLQYSDTVVWVFWPVKTISHITYTVLAET